MPKLPFGALPGHWGLKGKTREIAKAEYELEGYALELQLLLIKKDELSEDEYLKKYNDIQLKNGQITQAQYNRALVERIKDDHQRQLGLLELDFKEGKITDLEYQKQSATLNGEPWVTVINMDFGKKSALEGSFELDWNELFVEKLQKEGYTGPSPDHIVNQWFMEVCRNVAMEEFDGTGDFTADSEANLDAVKRWSQETESYPKDRKGYK